MTKTAPTAIIGGDVMKGFGSLSSNSGGEPGGRGAGRTPAAGRAPGTGFTADAEADGAVSAGLVALDRAVGAADETSYDCPQPPQETGPETEPGEAC